MEKWWRVCAGGIDGILPGSLPPARRFGNDGSATVRASLVRRAPGLVQPAFALQPEEPRLLLGHAVGELGGGLPVADRHVALDPQRMVRQVVARQVVVDVLVVP